MAIVRKCFTLTGVVVDTSGNIANCTKIPIGDFGIGGVILPGSTSLTSLNFYVATTENGTYTPVYDATPTIVSRTVQASRAFDIPSQVMGFMFLKIVGNAAGTLDVHLKS